MSVENKRKVQGARLTTIKQKLDMLEMFVSLRIENPVVYSDNGENIHVFIKDIQRDLSIFILDRLVPSSDPQWTIGDDNENQ